VGGPIRSIRGTGESEQCSEIADSAQFLSVWKRFGATSQTLGVARLTRQVEAVSVALPVRER